MKREAVDQSSLASTFVKSPDPRQKKPPLGQELTMEWRLPKEALEQDPILLLSILYKNHTEETLCYPVERRRGLITYPVLDEKYQETQGFLTYKAEIIGKDKTVLKEWKQQLWTDLITFD